MSATAVKTADDDEPRTRPQPSRAVVLGVTALLVLLSRLPVLGAGYGRDADAWRIALAGRVTAATGQWTLSRRPGYPVLEAAATVLSSTPAWVAVLLTAALSGVACAAFADLLLTLRVRWWPLLVAGLALTPVVVRSSTTFMDYMWAFAALMVAIALQARGRLVPAGAFLGLAVACRPSTAAMGPALLVALLLVGPGSRASRLVRWVVPGAVVVVVAFLPTVLTYGTAFVGAVPEVIPWRVIAGRGGLGAWGLLGCLALVGVTLLVLLHHPRERVRALDDRQRAWALAAVLGTVLTVLVFEQLPADSGYLLPAAPLLLLLAGLLASVRVLVPLVVLLAAGLVFAPGRVPSFYGPTVAEDLTAREAQRQAFAGLPQRIAALPPGSVVLAREDLPVALAQLPTSLLTPGVDTASAATRVTLAGGQVLAWGPADGDLDLAASGRLYVLPNADRYAPDAPRLVG